MANKIRFGLTNVHYAKLTRSSSGVTFATPVRIPGAVSLTLTPEGSRNEFRADNSVYWNAFQNNGYSGDLEFALIPNDFRAYALGEVVDSNGQYVEIVKAKHGEFAILFEFDGDVSATRHVIYNCVADRPSVAGKTTEETLTPDTETISIKADPIVCELGEAIKSRCSAESDNYATFFESVGLPEAVSNSEGTL